MKRYSATGVELANYDVIVQHVSLDNTETPIKADIKFEVLTHCILVGQLVR